MSSQLFTSIVSDDHSHALGTPFICALEYGIADPVKKTSPTERAIIESSLRLSSARRKRSANLRLAEAHSYLVFLLEFSREEIMPATTSLALTLGLLKDSSGYP